MSIWISLVVLYLAIGFICAVYFERSERKGVLYYGLSAGEKAVLLFLWPVMLGLFTLDEVVDKTASKVDELLAWWKKRKRKRSSKLNRNKE